MDERITELESIALTARDKKGRMDSVSRDKASTLLASIWVDSSIDPGPTLQLMEEIKAEAIAEAIRSCWPQMDNDRRNLFRRWVPTPSSEKSYRRLTFLVASIIETDGTTALYWLGLLIPSGRKGLSKEARETLATVLFGERVFSFERLMHGGGSDSELSRICAALLDIATDPTLSVSAMTRSRLASAILGYLEAIDTPKDSLAVSDLRAKIAADAKRWPTALRDQLFSTSEVRPAPILSPPPAQPVFETQPERKIGLETNAPIATPLEVGPLQEELPRLEGELGKRISAMTREVDLLRRAHECTVQLVEAALRVEAQRESANRELQRVKEAFRFAESELDRVKSDAARENQRANDLGAALEQLRVDGENERKHLGQQVSANANGRVLEFKNKLGLNLSRLVVDLPGV